MEQIPTAEAVNGGNTHMTRRLTRVERARLEALQAFGCEDFGTIMESTKKVSLKSKLNSSKENGKEENKCQKTTRQSGGRRSGLMSHKQKMSQNKHRPTKAELSVLESLKCFDNNSLADITNSSKRMVSKFLNKPKTSKQAKKKSLTDNPSISGGSENVCESDVCIAVPEDNDKGASIMMAGNRSLLSLKINKEVFHPTPDRKAKSAPSKHLKHLLEVNRKVLDTAKELDQ